MPLHPDAQAALDARTAFGIRPVSELTPEQGREQSIRYAATAQREPVARVEDRAIPVPYGEIPIRLYYPSAAMGLPILVYFHGGGWVVGNLETADAVCREFTNAAQCLVISVNYRHAPEHKFPAAAEDAYAATRWVSENAASFGGDPARLAVSGSSAGGNLAAVVSWMALERGTPRLALQVLLVPALDYNFERESYAQFAEGYGLTRASMHWFWQHYLTNEQEGAHPYASPLRAGNAAGLAPAFIATAEYDPLRDEGEAYAEKLRAAGVPVKYHCYEGMIHPFLGKQSTLDAAAALRAAWGS